VFLHHQDKTPGIEPVMRCKLEHEAGREPLGHPPESIAQVLANPPADRRRERPPERLRDAAGDTGHGVAVTTQGDGVAHTRLPVIAFQKTQDGFGYRALTGDIEAISRTDVFQVASQIVVETPLQLVPNRITETRWS